MTAALAGFSLSLSLILAIGAQNAFVLRQGLVGRHVGLVVGVCCLSEGVLIFAGVAGAGALTRALPGLDLWMRGLGAVFLLVYGARSLWAAWRAGAALRAGGRAESWQAALASVLALTWLNPHVYLDTVMLLGAVSAQSAQPILFGTGALTASVLFFVALGYGARVLAPVFARPLAWRVLDAVVGVTMWIIAGGLIAGALSGAGG